VSIIEEAATGKRGEQAPNKPPRGGKNVKVCGGGIDMGLWGGKECSRTRPRCKKKLKTRIKRRAVEKEQGCAGNKIARYRGGC